MEILKDSKQIQLKLKKINNNKIGFIPTMGALHQGHLSLISAATKKCEIVVVSIFINPKQFDNQEDLDSYPKNLKQDIKFLEGLNIDYLFIPEQKHIYNKPTLTSIHLKHLADNLCGSTRSGHFEGVALIIIKLFNIIKPDIAFFGLKDYQQYYIIKQLAKDLSYDILIEGIETIREKTGLAMSSRNQKLSKNQRENIAPLIFQELNNLNNLINNNHDRKTAINTSKEFLLQNGFSKIDYLEILNDDLTPYRKNHKEARIFIAAFLDEVRLIDNISL